MQVSRWYKTYPFWLVIAIFVLLPDPFISLTGTLQPFGGLVHLFNMFSNILNSAFGPDDFLWIFVFLIITYLFIAVVLSTLLWYVKRRLKPERKKYVTWAIIILLIILFCYPFIQGLFQYVTRCQGDECFPQMTFPNNYIDCGITNSRLKILYEYEGDPAEVKACIWEAYNNCQEAYAKINHYGIEGQTGMSSYVIVKNNGSGCIINETITYLNSENEPYVKPCKPVENNPHIC